MADGSVSHLTAAQQLELAQAIQQRAFHRYACGTLCVIRARTRVQRMNERLQRMERELARRKVQAEVSDDEFCRLLLGERS